ncbi:MAG: hypothetical protein P1Q69_00905 [Candidatus Thorarchaeota archaeon]|nr:hypothetical protein [Candidatus Thorarchaeota archaeon]
MAPQQEDIRIIVQDTPTGANPWSTIIHVPHLVGFAEKFRGLAKRDGNVAPEEVFHHVTNVHPMHGRGVTLSSIQASVGDLSKVQFPKILDDALTLVPSTLRRREPVSAKKEKEEERLSQNLPWQSTFHTVGTAGGSTMDERTGLALTKPPPTPRRGTPKYIDAYTYDFKTPKKRIITRRWFYEQTPTQIIESDDEYYDSTQPLGIEDVWIGEIDTLETRERELRRLHYAAKHLIEQSSLSNDLKFCCKKIERYCAIQFGFMKENPSLKTSEFFLDALRRVKGIILEDSSRLEIWNVLLPHRENTVTLLNTEKRDALEEVIEQIPDVLQIYGNNLFLAVLSTLSNRNPSLAEYLWTPISEWIFYQLGIRIQYDTTKSVYSFQAILSNHRSRTKTLSQTDLPKRAAGEEEIGAIFWKESETGFDAMLLIPHDGRYLTGIIERLRERWIPPKWYACKTTAQHLKEFAEESLASTDKTPIVISIVQNTQVLWVPVMDEYDDDFRWGSFTIAHGKPGTRRDSIPWLKLETTISLSPPNSIPAIPDSIDDTLRKLARVKHRAVPVKLMVSVNKHRQVYEVNLEGESFEEQFEFSRTSELVRFLRSPIHQGEGYRSKGHTLTWDHRNDIIYNEDSISFLIPLIHRSRFYPAEYQYPKTCKALLATKQGTEVSIITRINESGFGILFEDLPPNSSLSLLEEATFSKSTLMLLTECE